MAIALCGMSSNDGRHQFCGGLFRSRRRIHALPDSNRLESRARFGKSARSAQLSRHAAARRNPHGSAFHYVSANSDLLGRLWHRNDDRSSRRIVGLPRAKLAPRSSGQPAPVVRRIADDRVAARLLCENFRCEADQPFMAAPAPAASDSPRQHLPKGRTRWQIGRDCPSTIFALWCAIG